MFGDKQPDKEEFHLPQCLTKDKIYHVYKDEMERAKEPVLSLSAFQELWLKSFDNVKISTVSLILYLYYFGEYVGYDVKLIIICAIQLPAKP